MLKKSSLIKSAIFSLIMIFLSTSPLILTEAIPNANLVPNSSFEVNSDGWSATMGTISRDGTTFVEGAYSLRVRAAFIGAYGSIVVCDPISITAGQYYDYEFHVKTDDGKLIRINLKWANSGSLVSTSWRGETSSTNWQIWTGTVQAPAGCNEVYFEFLGVNAEEELYYWHIDDIQLNYPSAPEFAPTIMIPLIGLVLATMIFVKQKKKE